MTAMAGLIRLLRSAHVRMPASCGSMQCSSGHATVAARRIFNQASGWRLARTTSEAGTLHLFLDQHGLQVQIECWKWLHKFTRLEALSQQASDTADFHRLNAQLAATGGVQAP